MHYNCLADCREYSPLFVTWRIQTAQKIKAIHPLVLALTFPGSPQRGEWFYITDYLLSISGANHAGQEWLMRVHYVCSNMNKIKFDGGGQ